MANIERELVSTDELLDHALRYMEAAHKHNHEPLMEARVLVEAARRQHEQQLRGAVDALRGVLTGRIVRDETENGDPILLDLSTDPATVVRFDRFGGQ